MKKFLPQLLLFTLVASASFAQVKDSYNPLPNTKLTRAIVEKTLFFPTGCGTPSGTASLNSDTSNRAALFFDSCGHKSYAWDPKTKAWANIGPDSTVYATLYRLLRDSTHLSNRIIDTAGVLRALINAQAAAINLKVDKTTTVNGHALNTNVVVSASDITTGTLPDAQLSGNVVTLTGSQTLTNKSISQGQITNLTTDLAARELLANKATDFSTVNNTLYPSVQAVKAYADALVVGLVDDRGNHSAASNTYPSTNGSGSGGSILKGDLYFISAAGVLGGDSVFVGDQLRALVDAPGSTSSNWALMRGKVPFTPENVTNKSTNTSLGTSNTLYPSQNAVKAYVDASVANGNTAYNKRLSSASLSSSTLTLTLADATTVTASVPTFNQNTSGTAANATTWSLLPADFSAITSGTPSAMVGYFTGTAKIVSSAGVKSYLGYYTSGDNVSFGTVSGSSFSGAGTGLTGTAASLNIGGNAATVTNGVYTTGSQSIGGAKDFSSSLSNSGINQWTSGTRYLTSIKAGTGLLEFNTNADVKSLLGYYTSGDNVSFGTISGGRATLTGQNGVPTGSGSTQTNGSMRLAQSSGQAVIDFGINGGSYSWMQVTNSSDLSLTYPLYINPLGGSVLFGGSIKSNIGQIESLGTSSGTVGSGAYVEIFNNSSQRGWLTQLNASHGLDYWYYNGSSWGVKYTFDNAGNVTFGGNLIAGNTGSSSPALITFQNSANGFSCGFSSSGTQRFVWLNGAPTEVMSLSSAGNLNASGSITGSSFFESSDIRQKSVHKTIRSKDGIDAIQYTFNPTGNDKYGYSAQQVKSIIPFAVTTGEDGFYKVDYSSVFTYKIAQLEKRINNLEKIRK